MKTWKNLFQEVIDPQNMRAAFKAAARDKGDYPAVIAAHRNPEEYIARLTAKLTDGTWRPPEHEAETISDGIKKKKRLIIKPSFEEQVVHHAVIQVLEPVFMRGMYEYSCGSIPGRGATYGKDYLERWIRNHPKQARYAFKGDVRHFFQSIDQGTLVSMLERVISDKRMIDLLTLIITCEKDPETGEGIPIGFYTSQWFSNFYLQGMDHFIKERLHAPCYVRYMDDIVIIGPSKRKLHRMRVEIAAYLEGVELKLKDDWQVFKFEYEDKNGNVRGRAIDFMGFEFHRNRTVLRKSIYFRAVRKARKMRKGKPNWYSSCQMLSYCGYLKQADCHRAFEESVRPYVNPKTLKAVVSKHDRRKANVHR